MTISYQSVLEYEYQVPHRTTTRWSAQQS